MTAKTTNLFLRDDTIFGVCEAIGQDFGFNPVWLRIALCVPVTVAPTWSIGAYALLGIIVLASRLIFPVPRAAAAAQAITLPAPVVLHEVVTPPVDAREPLALAA